MTKSLIARLSEKYTVNAETGCWEWTSYRTTCGYGKCLQTPYGRRAHRVMYSLLIGPLNPSTDLDHLCRNRICVNPAHLEPVSRKENLARGIWPEVHRQRNKARTHCKRGHEFTKENTRLQTIRGYVVRQCRQCNRDLSLRRYYEQKEVHHVSS